MTVLAISQKHVIGMRRIDIWLGVTLVFFIGLVGVVA
jgi:hypothetical protein